MTLYKILNIGQITLFMLTVKNGKVIGWKKLEGGICGAGNILFPDLVLAFWAHLVS